MDTDSEVANLQPFSPHTSQQLTEAAEALTKALHVYTTVVAAITELNDSGVLEEAGDRLAVVGARFAQAHMSHLTLGAPIGDVDLLDLTEDGDDENCGEEHAVLLDEESAAGPISVFTRQDFVVTDAATLIAAARESLDHNGVSSIGHVLYELIHRDGRDSLDQREGLIPTASITLFQRGETPLRIQMNANNPDYQPLMHPDGETLFSFGEVW